MTGLYGALPKDAVWENDTARAGCRCHFCQDWIWKGDDVVRAVEGYEGYVAHPACKASAQVRAQNKQATTTATATGRRDGDLS